MLQTVFFVIDDPENRHKWHSTIMMSVIMLSVVMLIVTVPYFQPSLIDRGKQEAYVRGKRTVFALQEGS